jgi:PAS domain S-box-containing protein
MVLLPLLATSLCTLLKVVFPDALGAGVPFLLYELMVAVAGWKGRTTGSLVALVSGGLFAWYFFLPLQGSFRFEGPVPLVQLVVFAVDGLVVTFVITLLHSSLSAAERLAGEREAALEASKQRQRRLRALSELNTALSRALTLVQVRDAVLEQGMRLAAADTCTLYALNASEDVLELVGARGVDPALLEEIRRLDASSGNQAFMSVRTGSLQWVEDEADYARLYPDLVKGGTARAKAFWSIPLVAEGRAHGLLGMGFYAPRHFEPEERELVAALGFNCAQALRRAQLYEHAEEARAEAERAKRSLDTTLRSIGDGVIATDARGQVVFMNPIAEQLTGWSETEARGRLLESVFRIVDEQSRKELENPARRVLQTGGIVGLANHTMLLSKQPGKETPIDDSGAPIRADDGEVLGVVLVFRDVSQQKQRDKRQEFLARALEALGSSLDYSETLARVAELTVPLLADWCAVDLVEPGTETLTRVAVAHVDPAKVALALELGGRYPPDPRTPRGRLHVMRTGRAEFYPELDEAQTLAGARDAEHARVLRQLALRSAILAPIAVGGRVLGVLTLVYAESERRYSSDDLAFVEDFARRAAASVENARLFLLEQQSRASADAANKAKDEFLATVSHELRTPLNAILGWSRMLGSAPHDDARAAKALGAIQRSAVNMTQLIEDLLDVSRIVSGRMRIELEPVEFSRVVETALEAIRPSAELKGISLERRLPSANGQVLGDAARLQQVVSNLLTNAIKFTPSGGHVSVELEARGADIELRVADDGRGIPAAVLPHIFAPFRQADGSITRHQGGLGLGLAIVRHLVDLHRGMVVAESPGEGKGSVFSVRLPAMVQRELMPLALTDQFDASADWPDLEDLHVLVVEDDVEARELLRAVLEQCRCRVSTAGTVDEAFRLLESHVPSLILSDIGMPGQDGYDLIRRIRSSAEPRLRAVPAIALTAYARGEDRWKALRAGFLMHIPKPIEPAEVVAAVANLVRARHS